MTSPLQSTLAALNVPVPERPRSFTARAGHPDLGVPPETENGLKDMCRYINELETALLLAVEAARVKAIGECARQAEDAAMDSDLSASGAKSEGDYDLAEVIRGGSHALRHLAAKLRSLAAQPGVGK